MKIKRNMQSMYQNNVVKKKIDLLLIREGEKILSKILIRLYIIIQYIVEENIFIVIVYTLSLHKKL